MRCTLHGDVHRHAYVHVSRHVCGHVYRHVHRHVTDACTDMCADMCTDMCTDMCADMCIRRVCRHVYRHVYRHVCRHVCSHVYKVCVQTCVRTCVPKCVRVFKCKHMCRHVFAHPSDSVAFSCWRNEEKKLPFKKVNILPGDHCRVHRCPCNRAAPAMPQEPRTAPTANTSLAAFLPMLGPGIRPRASVFLPSACSDKKKREPRPRIAAWSCLPPIPTWSCLPSFRTSHSSMYTHVRRHVSRLAMRQVDMSTGCLNRGSN